MSKPQKAKVRRERTIHVYAELWSASEATLSVGRSLAKAGDKSAKWQFLSCAILTAFAFEAYMNHIGSQILKCWLPDLERLAPLGKLEVISGALKLSITLDKGTRPVQSIVNLIDLRNTMAHGKTEDLPTREDVVDVNERFHLLIVQPVLANWENLIRNERFCVRARQDVHSLMKAIHDAQTVESTPLFAPGRRRGSGELLGDA